jgi:sarcosine oxidase, subunit alpha
MGADRLRWIKAKEVELAQNDIPFQWRGKTLRGATGDSIASALLRNGVRSLAVSRKRHLPMGYSGSYIAGVLARVDGMPNVRLETVPLKAGARVEAQNCWPSQRFDLTRLARLIPPNRLYGGFEQSALFPSASTAFLMWEHVLAHFAGVAQAPDRTDAPAIPGLRYATDVLVIGAGPAGRAAANEAARAGRDVTIVSRSPRGGRFAAAAGAELEGLHPAVRFIGDCDLFGAYRGGALLVGAKIDPSEPAVAFDAKQVVIATGRHSVPPLVRGASLPGVMDYRTALRLAYDHGIKPGQRVAVIGVGAEPLAAARLQSLGVSVVHVGSAAEVRRIRGLTAVEALEAEAVVACDAVVHAGPWRPDPSLAFQFAADGSHQLGTDMGAGPAVVGDARLSGDPLPLRHLHDDALVCPCMDVTVGEIVKRVSQGHTDLEVLKRLTACGMGPCQGFPCWEHLAALVEYLAPDAPQRVARPSLRAPRRAITVAQAAGLYGVVEPDR